MVAVLLEMCRSMDFGLEDCSGVYRTCLPTLLVAVILAILYIYTEREIFHGHGEFLVIKRHAEQEGILYNFSNVKPHEMKILQSINSPLHTKRIFVTCCKSRGLCGGSGDRIRGLSYIASVAAEMGANLTIDPSYPFGFPQICDSSKPYVHLIDNFRAPNFQDIFLKNDDVQMSSNWDTPREGSPFHGWCNSYECGNLIYHYFVPPTDGLLQASSFSNSFLDSWSRNSTVLHVRTGGSKIKVGDSTVKSVKWNDGYESDLPNQILAWASSLNSNMKCKSPITLISDSVRFSSELSYLAPQGLQILRCCVSPIHIDRSTGDPNVDPSLQQYFDLLVMAKSNKIFTTHGGFATLGASFLGSPDYEKKLVPCTNVTCLDTLLNLLQCVV